MTIEKLVPETANENFTKILSNNKIVICLYHWKMCSHCILFKPIWNQVANKYKNDLMITDIELDAMRHLQPQHMVQMFPSIIVYKNGRKSIEFDKRREAPELDSFMKSFIDEYKPPKPPKPVKAVKPVKTQKKPSKKVSSKPKGKK